MGIGQKIKNALDPDHERGYEGRDGQPPGAYPDETSRHHPNDTRDYVQTAGASGEPRNAGLAGAKAGEPTSYNLGGDRVGGHDLHEPGRTTGVAGQRTSHGIPEAAAHEYAREKGPHAHKQHDSGVDLARGGERQNDPYWGNIESGRHGAGDRTAAGPGGATAGGLTERELAERPRHGHGHGPHGAARHDLQPSGEAVGGGVYNTVTGAGSNEDTTTGRHHPAGSKNPAVSSGALPSGAVAGSTTADPVTGARRNLYDEKREVYGAPSSRDDNAGRGLAGASAGASGLAAATEDTRRHHHGNHHNKEPGRHHEPAPGEPRSSMLDPYSTEGTAGRTSGPGPSMLDPYATHSSGDATRRHEHIPGAGEELGSVGGPRGSGPGHVPGTGFEDELGRGAGHRLGHGKGAAGEPIGREPGHIPGQGFEDEVGRGGGRGLGHNKEYDVEPYSTEPGVGRGVEQVPGQIGGRGAGSGPGHIAGEASAVGGANTSAGPGVSSGLGKNHYGPAHEGAKVLHQCHNCGADNDISHYFKKDAVYRIGS